MRPYSEEHPTNVKTLLGYDEPASAYEQRALVLGKDVECQTPQLFLQMAFRM